MNAAVRKARKKPVEIEFMVWPGGDENARQIMRWIAENSELIVPVMFPNDTPRYPGSWHSDYEAEGEALTIDTLEGRMIARPGDVIIRGVSGEFYPCKPDIFEATYDIVTEAS